MRRIYRRMIRFARNIDPRRWIALLRRSSWPFRDRYVVEDNTQVIVFTGYPGKYSSYQPVQSLSAPRARHVNVSVILTARNEQDTVRQTIGSLLHQTRLPDEIVVTETGSTDSTLELLHEVAAESAVPIRVVVEPGAKIARGRNAAIRQAHGPVIAVTDFGCEPEAEWLERLVAPFEINPGNQVTAGCVKVVEPSGKVGSSSFWPAADQIDPQSYLPPGASVAFTKDAWAGVGGYPEWLTLTGEDTYFDLELKRTTTQWAFTPEAAVCWQAPASRSDRLRKPYRWAVGDGEIGVLARTYQRLLLKAGFLFLGPLGLAGLLFLGVLNGWPVVWLSSLLLASAWLMWLLLRLPRRGNLLRSIAFEGGLTLARLAGYLTGLRQQQDADSRRWPGLRGMIVILSGVPVDDTGGGARGAQIALELIRRQFLVVFLHQYPKYETTHVEVSIGHPNLITSRFSRFSLPDFIQRFGDLLQAKPTTVLVELPLPGYLPIIRELRQRGGRVIYDLMDDWHTSLGASWYSERAEQELVGVCDVLCATAPTLQARLEKLSGRTVKLLPNAVNLRLFQFDRMFPRPADLPAAGWTAIYIGALWGEWFDWDLLVAIARSDPACSVVLIGDYRGQCPESLPNLHFLGLKPQRELPAYLAHAQVAIIPWKVNAITRATSPLKVYEYLAMHKPVVVPNLPLLADLPLVFCSSDTVSFLQNLALARQAPFDPTTLERFLSQNSWQARVDSILDIIN